MHRYVFMILSLYSMLSATAYATMPHQLCEQFGEKKKQQLTHSINDVSFLNPTKVACIIAPRSEAEITSIVKRIHEWNKQHKKIHLSVFGSRHSQGGHIALTEGIALDMRHLNQVHSPIKQHGLWSVKVEAGAYWNDVHDIIRQYHGHSLANKVQQSSTPFSVGGSLSVNAHGRSFSYGSMIHSVQDITVVLPNGNTVKASRAENPTLFKQVIGGYGLFGIIVNATLELNNNHHLTPHITPFNSPQEYITQLEKTLQKTPRHKIKRNSTGMITSKFNSPIAFLFATLSLSQEGFLTKGVGYQYYQRETIDHTGFIHPDPEPHLFNLQAWATKIGFAFKRKGHLIAIAEKAQASFLKKQDSHLKVLTPPIKPILAVSDHKKPDLLQEYFIPIKNMPAFLRHVKSVFENNHLILSNASLRFIPKSSESSLLTYESATEDQLAIVLYFSLPLNKQNISAAKSWTQNLVDKALSLNGRYYLPYQQWPSKAQFELAYPSHNVFRKQKLAADPYQVFSNRFYEFYLRQHAH